MDNVLFQTKRQILYIKNDIKNLYKVLKHIESALSNGGSIIFIAIFLLRNFTQGALPLLVLYCGKLALPVPIIMKHNWNRLKPPHLRNHFTKNIVVKPHIR